jgi:hypothetical protein
MLKTSEDQSSKETPCLWPRSKLYRVHRTIAVGLWLKEPLPYRPTSPGFGLLLMLLLLCTVGQGSTKTHLLQHCISPRYLVHSADHGVSGWMLSMTSGGRSFRITDRQRQRAPPERRGKPKTGQSRRSIQWRDTQRKLRGPVGNDCSERQENCWTRWWLATGADGGWGTTTVRAARVSTAWLLWLSGLFLAVFGRWRRCF